MLRDDPLRHARQADRVALLHGQVAERPGELAGVLDLGDAGRAKTHRAAGVEHEAAAQIGVGLELLDVEPIRPAVGPPVEPPQIVARDVLAILGELDARAAMRAGMPPRNAPLHRPAREQRNTRQPRQHLGIEKAAGMAVGEHAASLHEHGYAAPSPKTTNGRFVITDRYAALVPR